MRPIRLFTARLLLVAHLILGVAEQRQVCSVCAAACPGSEAGQQSVGAEQGRQGPWQPLWATAAGRQAGQGRQGPMAHPGPWHTRLGAVKGSRNPNTAEVELFSPSLW